MQNALFRRVRLSSPGQTWRHLTEKRILVQTPHGKAHSVLIDSRKGALCDPQIAQTAPFRHAAAPGRCRTTPRQAAGHYGKRLNWANALEQPPRQPAGHYGKRPNWANALEQPPASLRGGLRQGLQISVRSLASRKGALCPTCGFQNVLFREAAPAECAFSLCPTCRMRFSVECAFPHLGKRRAASRKSAFCHLRLTEKRILYPVTHGKPHSAIPRSRRLRLSVTRRLQNAPFRDVAAPGRCGATARQAAGHYGKRPNWANALEQPPRQPAGRVVPSSRNGDDHVCDRPRPSCTSTRPLKSCGLVQTTATRVQTPTREVPFSIAR